MTKVQLFVGQLVVFVAGLGLLIFGWVCHYNDLATFGALLATGAATAFSIPRPADK